MTEVMLGNCSLISTVYPTPEIPPRTPRDENAFIPISIELFSAGRETAIRARITIRHGTLDGYQLIGRFELGQPPKGGSFETYLWEGTHNEFLDTAGELGFGLFHSTYWESNPMMPGFHRLQQQAPWVISD